MFSHRLLFTSILSLIVLTSCSQEKYKPAQKAAGEMQATANILAATQADVGETLTALNTLMNPTGGDLRSKYNAYTKSLDKLRASARKTEDTANDMRKKGEAYFANWNKEIAEIQNEDIRARSQARQAEVNKRFTEISDLYQKAKAEFKPFMTYLNDINTALGSDLTTAGLQSVRDVVASANAEGTKLQGTIGDLVARFREFGASVSPKGK